MFGYVFDTMHIQILGLFIFSRLKDMHSSAWNFSSFCYLKPYKQQKKVALSFVFVVIHCVMMNFDGAWCDGMGFFWFMYSSQVCIHVSSCSYKSCEFIWVVHSSCSCNPLGSLVSFPWALRYRSCMSF
jgi:hypothetical protein